MQPSYSKRSSTYILVLVSAVFALSFVCGIFAQHLLERNLAAAYDQPLRLFWEVWDLLEENYYGELPLSDERTYGAIRGVLAVLNDPYTVLLEPQSGEMERDRLAGVYGGVGVDLWRDGYGDVVLAPYLDSPAEAAGIRDGDILLTIDGDEIASAPLDEIRVRLRGEVGTEVTLGLLRRPDQPLNLAIIMQEIVIPSVTYRMLDQAPHIGYLHIRSFTGRTSDEAGDALEELIDLGATSLLLDLRDNGGGLLSPAVETADLLLDGGVILYESRRNEEEMIYEAQPGGVGAGLPLAVLVNRSTASAAEIVVGALQAQGRAMIIGEPTYGKGSVQLIYTLSDGSALHITSAIWTLPDHDQISPEGLQPDILLPRAEDLIDNQLERAIQYLETGE